jgi:hypothetical protein
MADVYRNWSHDIPMGGGGHWKDNRWIPARSEEFGNWRGTGPMNLTNVHFHYMTETPEVNAAFYIDGTRK